MDSDIELSDNKHDEVSVDDGQDNNNETIEEPKIGMLFSTEEEVRSYYMKYAKHKGFGVRRRNSKQGDDGKVRWFTLVCARQGTPKSQATNFLRPRQTERIGCKARINAILNDEGGYTLSSVILEHTHVCSPEKARHFRCFKKVDARVTKGLEINNATGICMGKNFKSSAVESGGYENVPLGEKECRNYIDNAQLRLGVGGAEALRNYFREMHKKNSDFYYEMDVDDDMRLRNVFWADARSRAVYQSFGDVITFDTTYLTNAYKMPFVSFVGVNHHGQLILLGCGLISSEDTQTFEWFFESWLKCMNNQAPNAIIADQNKAIQLAIVRVFPNSRYRFCLSHIMKKFVEKFGSHSQYEEIKSTLQKCVYDSLTEQEFEERWFNLLDAYHLQENEWLGSLHSDKRFWVPAYVKDTFWAGMSITQRSESMNAFFDNYVNSKTTLKQFLDQYNSALRRKVENEAVADFNSFNTEIPCISHYPLEKQFQKAYTISKFKEVQDEFRGFLYISTSLLGCEGAKYTYAVADEIKVSDEFIKHANFIVALDEDPLEVKCSCKLFEFKGILCRHALRVLVLLGKNELPSKYIFDRWRKDIKRKYTFIKSSYEANCNSERQRYDRILNCFYELASNASKTEKSCVKLIDQIEQLKIEYLEDNSRCGGKTDKPTTSMDGTTTSTSKAFSPLVVQSKKKPPSKRKMHPVETDLRKSTTRRLRSCEVEQSSQLSREDRANEYHESSPQHEAPQTQDQQNQVWTHMPNYFCTPSTAAPLQMQPSRLHLSDPDGGGHDNQLRDLNDGGH
ncbi:hypothetical protein CIPAW_01G072300 [Carya illinoinensis]|uniref:Protein FAR1-RELATED SEQUENCE n=1 Tax=Carya illinoinensis TaxID=32201 RepID=A0A8T1RK53_CARIL|nr:hypothetical protein CIPAW_01G072300 [Carya illinoinensis]KAG6667029.1 hypothetical protein CIPAW_01G072300 [Carya illinoinensis]